MPFRSFAYAVRSLRRAPALTLISIVTVALGVGAGTALFSVVKAVLLNPLPYPRADRLMWVAEVNEKGGAMQVPLENFDDWQQGNHSFAAMTAFGEGPVNAGGGDTPERTHGAEVTQDFFTVMGVQPRMGRTFDPGEQKFGAAGTVVLGDGLWHKAYGGDPRIVGRRVKLMGQPFTVIGVMPPGFDYPNGSELWVAAGAFFPANSRTAHNFRVVGRLRLGVTPEQAREDIGAIARRLKREYPSPFMAKDAAVVSLDRHIVGEVRPALLMLFGAVGFVLLIVCVNVANLLMVRVTARMRELSVRVALGAGRIELFRQLLIESVTLAGAGGALGFVIAFWSMDLIRVLLPADLPRSADIRIDGGVAAFAVAISAATGILFGLLPAWRASRLNVNQSLKAGSRAHTAGRSAHRAQAALVISEICLSLVLVAAAGLLARSFSKLRAVDPGFDADHVLVARVSFEVPSNGFGRLSPMFTRLVDSLRSIPGVDSAGLVKNLPLDVDIPDGHFNIENRPQSSGTADANYNVVSPGYLTTLRIPILRGRDLSPGDTSSSAPVAVITADMARIYWPGEDPIGRRIWFDSFVPQQQWLTIVGIAGDVRDAGLARPLEPTAYVSHTQAIPSRLLDENLVLRTSHDPETIVAAVRERLREADREAVVKFETMDQVLSRSVARQRFQLQVLGGFALLAMALAAIGLYGVLAYMVTSNRGEIAIRMALGAQPGAIFRLVTGRALRLGAAGAVIGLAGCLAIRGMLASLMFGIGPSDPATLVFATALLILVALGASWFPARRAMRTDPGSALRED
ncbi:MAG TPA: ABC transporter permease [Bryobacteraceae bacterium]|nr:ABC transporter permease [Bryobacteraceae bacterium]